MVADGSRKVIVELVPVKLVIVVQLIRLLDAWMWPFKPADSCRLKTRPFVLRGTELLKASCSLNVLLEMMLTVLVVERFPAKSIAYALTMLVPTIKGTVVVQFVQPFVVSATLHGLLFNW